MLPGIEHHCYPNCFAEINSSLGIVFISNIIVGNLGEVLPPIINERLRTAAESKGAVLGEVAVLSDVEKQFISEECVSFFLYFSPNAS